MTLPTRLGALSLALFVAARAGAEIRHEAGAASRLYEAYLGHALGSDESGLERASELATDSSFLAVERAYDAGRRGDREAALEWIGKAIARDPDNCDARLLLARLQFRMLEGGQVTDQGVGAAVEHAEAAMKLGCADGEIYDRLAATHAVLAARAGAAGDEAEAGRRRAAQRRVLESWAGALRQDIAYQRLADFARATDDAALEEKALSALIESQDRSVLLLQRLAAVRQQLGRCEQAMPLLEEAAASPALDAYAAISVRVNLGQCALEVGPVRAGLDAFEKALDLDPTNRIAAIGRAEALWMLGRRSEAIEAVMDLGKGRRGGAPRKPDPRRELDDALTRARWLDGKRADEALAEARRAVGIAASASPREQAVAQALLSAVLLDRGDAAAAEAAAREGLEREPSSEPSLLALVASLWSVGRKSDAVTEIARIERTVSPSPAWLQRIARWEAARGLDEAARGHAARALPSLEAGAVDVLARQATAEILLAAGDPAGAEEHLRAALAERPDDDDLTFALADALAGQGRREEAMKLLPAADGADPYLLARLAGWHAEHRAPPPADGTDVAVTLAMAARARFGPGDPPAQLARFDAFVAGAQMAAHRADDAARSFAEALSHDDVLHPVERWMGATSALEMAGRLPEALAMAGRAAAAWPDEGAPELRRAALLSRLGRHDEARASADRAIFLLGGQLSAHAQVASALADAGAADDARRILDAALPRFPAHASWWLASGRARERAGDIEGALGDIRRALELDPDSAVAQNALGYMLADRGRELEFATALIRKALRSRPHEAAYLDSLGWALVRAGRLEEGRAELEKALARERDPVIVMHFATVLDTLGTPAAALPLYREALTGGLDEDADRVRARVAELSAAPAAPKTPTAGGAP